MSHWHTAPDLAQLNAVGANTLIAQLGIRFDHVDDHSLTASMPVDERTRQPSGRLHGGASVVLAETLGSVASQLCIDTSRFFCVGLEVNANHLRGVRSGRVQGTARPVHVGRTTHVWDIRLVDEQGKPTCIARLTVAVVPLGEQPPSG